MPENLEKRKSAFELHLPVKTAHIHEGESVKHETHDFDQVERFKAKLESRLSAKKGNETNERATRRREQNRAAQRAYRERKEKYIKELEDKISDLEKQILENNNLKIDNRKLRSRLNQLEAENNALKAKEFTFSVSPDIINEIQKLLPGVFPGKEASGTLVTPPMSSSGSSSPESIGSTSPSDGPAEGEFVDCKNCRMWSGESFCEKLKEQVCGTNKTPQNDETIFNLLSGPMWDPLSVDLSSESFSAYRDANLFPPQADLYGEETLSLFDLDDLLPLQEDNSRDKDNSKVLTCDLVWSRIKQHPKFAEIDLDHLCDELAKKATCTPNGPTVPEETVTQALNSLSF
ncbi:uncharacterized protein VTP21DRAFT_267 [Calcarisporiella thermophila]|uniref:uncharacterized protein n=1 Tax=Calcarisporiella thermophila TaxID=911321 RepID=UPI003743F616